MSSHVYLYDILLGVTSHESRLSQTPWLGTQDWKLRIWRRQCMTQYYGKWFLWSSDQWKGGRRDMMMMMIWSKRCVDINNYITQDLNNSGNLESCSLCLILLLNDVLYEQILCFHWPSLMANVGGFISFLH